MAGFVQGNKKTVTGAASTTLAFASNVASGNLLVATLSVTNGAGLAFSDNLNGSTWTVRQNVSTTGSAADGALGDKANTAGGSCTVTVSITTAQNMGINILEETGIQSTPFDQSNSHEVTSASPAATQITTSVACLAVSNISVTSASTTISNSTANWTVEENTSPNATFDEQNATADMVQSSSGAVNTTWSVGTSQDCLVIMATYKLSGAAAAATPTPMRTLRMAGV